MSQSLGKGTNVGNSQMEWLYDSNSGKPTNDDYLLGKAVDKNFERMGTEGQINAVEYDCCPESIFSSQVEHQVDLQRKLQEDPLVSLKMKEVDTRKKILDNPLKMREINSYIDALKRKKHKKEKKRKKHKKHKESEKDDDLDSMLLQKLKGISGEAASSNTSSHKDDKHDRKSSRHSRHKSSSDSSSDESNLKDSRKESKSSVEKHRSKHYGREKYNSSKQNRYSDISSKDYQDKRDYGRYRSKSSPRRRSRSPQNTDRKRDTKDNSESERAKKLQEMMENANWREEQRSKKVKSHRLKESEEEAARLEKHDPSFLRKELSKAAEAGSVEKRIKSNKHNIQRGFSSMSENFARR